MTDFQRTIAEMRARGILWPKAIDIFRRQYLQTCLAANRGNLCATARELGLHHNTVSRLVEELEIDHKAIKRGLRREIKGKVRGKNFRKVGTEIAQR